MTDRKTPGHYMLEGGLIGKSFRDKENLGISGRLIIQVVGTDFKGNSREILIDEHYVTSKGTYQLTQGLKMNFERLLFKDPWKRIEYVEATSEELEGLKNGRLLTSLI